PISLLQSGTVPLIQQTGRSFAINDKRTHLSPPGGEETLLVPIVIRPRVLPMPEDLILRSDQPTHITSLYEPPPAGRPGDIRSLSRSDHRSGSSGSDIEHSSDGDTV
ncbi:MAG: hypothetical protein V1862_12225, partial [Methanobacteriota archaeon]